MIKSKNIISHGFIYTVVDFHYAGGVKSVMKRLAGKLHLDVPTIYGNTWGELLEIV